MPLSDEAGAVLIRRHQTAVAGISRGAADRLTAIWDALPGYDEVDIGRFTARAASATNGALLAARGAGVGFYSTLMGVRPPRVDQAAVAVAPDVRSAFSAHWHALAQGRPYEEAVAAGRSALEAEVDHAVVSTARRTGDHVARESGQRVIKWRRALSTGACPWCRQVADRGYRSAESADFGHPRCHCTPVPLTVDSNPAEVVNEREAEVVSTSEVRGVEPASAISRLPGGPVGKAAREALDEIAKVHRVPEGMPSVPVGISDGQANGVYTFNNLKATPSGIRVKASGDHLSGTFTHEFGHYLDHQANLVDQATDFGRANWGSSPVGRRNPLMSAFFDAVEASPTKNALVEAAAAPRAKLTGAAVANSKAEVWARAYHQWIATRSGSSTMKAEIAEIRAKGEMSKLMQWDDEEFEPIAQALDAIFDAAGLLS